MADDLICTTCLHIGYPKSITKGSFLTELLLWLLGILPGVVYSVWRLTTRYKGCPKCGSTPIISVGSPMGRKLVADLGMQVVPAEDVP
jgi:hypothetical protein